MGGRGDVHHPDPEKWTGASTVEHMKGNDISLGESKKSDLRESRGQLS